jgi:hypothetical protein
VAVVLIVRPPVVVLPMDGYAGEGRARDCQSAASPQENPQRREPMSDDEQRAGSIRAGHGQKPVATRNDE